MHEFRLKTHANACYHTSSRHLSQNVSVLSFESAQNFMPDRKDLPDSCGHCTCIYSIQFKQRTRNMQIETFVIETLQSGVCLLAILATRFVKRKQVFVNTPRKKTIRQQLRTNKK